MHPTLPLVACVGLDRKLWTWDIHTKRMVDCVYLRQRLNCLLICEDGGWNDTNNYGGVVVSEENEHDAVGLNASGDWEDETDEVQDYIDSDREDEMGGESSDGDDGSDSSLEDTQSESGESESSEEEEEDNDEDGSDEMEMPLSKQQSGKQLGHSKKKRKI